MVHLFTSALTKLIPATISNWRAASQSNVVEIEAWDDLLKLSRLKTTLSMTALCQIYFRDYGQRWVHFSSSQSDVVNNLIATIDYVTSASSPSATVDGYEKHTGCTWEMCTTLMDLKTIHIIHGKYVVDRCENYTHYTWEICI